MYSPSRRVILGVALALVAPLILSAQGNDLARLVGTWKLNLAKSKYDPGPAPKSNTRTFEDWGGGLFHVTNQGVNAQSNPSGSTFVARYDGKDYPMASRNSATLDTISYRSIDAYTTEYTTKSDGKVNVVYTRTVSKDGKTLTERGKGTNAQGQAVNNVLVWDKQ